MDYRVAESHRYGVRTCSTAVDNRMFATNLDIWGWGCENWFGEDIPFSIQLRSLEECHKLPLGSWVETPCWKLRSSWMLLTAGIQFF